VCNFFVVWASCNYPLLGHTTSQGRCWAAIQFSHHPEPSGHAVHGKVDGRRWRTTWSTVCFSASHSHAAEWAIPHLCKQKRPTTVWRRLSQTHTVLGWAIPGRWVLMSGVKAQSLIVLSSHSAFHLWCTHSAALLLLSDELTSHRCLHKE